MEGANELAHLGGLERIMAMASTDKAPARVAIVDDFVSIRRWLRHVLDGDPRLVVAAEAGNADEARQILRHQPIDVVTLDVDMPGMSGLEFLSRLMIHRPMPVVMVSALTERGSREAVEALSLGAVDCIEKPRTALDPNLARQICDRVWHASQTRVRAGQRSTAELSAVRTQGTGAAWSGPIILLGSSTGGVAALETVLAELEGVEWPVVIAQHMPEKFLRSFCRRLNELFARRFAMADDGLELRSNHAVLAIGKDVSTHLVRPPGGPISCRIAAPSARAVYRPSVNDLFHSAADAGLAGAAAVLTGMGDDGAAGLLALHRRGVLTLAQNEQSCVVFGMPKAAQAAGAAQRMLDPAEIGRFITRHAGKHTRAEKGELT